jgi:dipeptidyl-peptidase-3
VYSDAIEKLSLVEKAKVLKIKTRRCFRTAKYYKTGSLKTWDDYNIAWSATEGKTH